METHLDPNACKIKTFHDFKSGDILGFSGHGLQSALINVATYGIPFFGTSHVGIVAKYDKRFVLFESMMHSPFTCIIKKAFTNGTQVHELIDAVNGYDGKVWHYPLYRYLSTYENEKLLNFLLEHLGLHYDRIGAIRAGGLAFSWVESLFRPEDLSSIFCSEYCAGAHKHTGILPTNHASKWSPNRLIRFERRWGILRQPVRLK